MKTKNHNKYFVCIQMMKTKYNEDKWNNSEFISAKKCE